MGPGMILAGAGLFGAGALLGSLFGKNKCQCMHNQFCPHNRPHPFHPRAKKKVDKRQDGQIAQLQQEVNMLKQMLGMRMGHQHGQFGNLPPAGGFGGGMAAGGFMGMNSMGGMSFGFGMQAMF